MFDIQTNIILQHEPFDFCDVNILDVTFDEKDIEIFYDHSKQLYTYFSIQINFKNLVIYLSKRQVLTI